MCSCLRMWPISFSCASQDIKLRHNTVPFFATHRISCASPETHCCICILHLDCLTLCVFALLSQKSANFRMAVFCNSGDALWHYILEILGGFTIWSQNGAKLQIVATCADCGGFQIYFQRLKAMGLFFATVSISLTFDSI